MYAKITNYGKKATCYMSCTPRTPQQILITTALGEKLDIQSVERFWLLLLEVLKSI
jgi:hypothetical protein